MVGKGAVELQGATVTAAGPPEAPPALGAAIRAAQGQHSHTAPPMPTGDRGRNTAWPSWARFHFPHWATS